MAFPTAESPGTYDPPPPPPLGAREINSDKAASIFFCAEETSLDSC